MSRARAVLLWVALLVLIRFSAAFWTTNRDTRALAHWLRELGVPSDEAILVVDMKANALPFYGYSNVHWVRHAIPPYPYYRPPPQLTKVLEGWAATRTVLLLPESNADSVMPLLLASARHCRRLGLVLDVVAIDCQLEPSE